MKPCCSYSPRILKGDEWACSDCGTILPAQKQEQLDFFGYVPYKIVEPPKCECGSDKTYGPGNNFHSATMPCPLYKKP